MSGDYSRQRFNSLKDFDGVLMQQGRVQLDAEWNELVEILNRRRRAKTADIIGRCGVPQETPAGFKIMVSDNSFTIGRGRIYVDGLLAENHGIGELEFDEVMHEIRGKEDTPYDKQPYLHETGSLPESGGPHLVYLDVWQREVSYLEDPDLLEKALGGVDTTTRLQTVWQVKVHTPSSNGSDITCATPDENINGWLDKTGPSAGRLSTKAVDVPSDEDPCSIPSSGGYRGLENQLYRVEVHKEGPKGTATFKWSRDNASVATLITKINGTTLTVERTGRDSILRFNRGDWVEITDDWREFDGQPGVMKKISLVDDATNEITLEVALTPDESALFPTVNKLTDSSRHTRMRRWDQRGKVLKTNGDLYWDLDDSASEGVILVPTEDTPIVLENGVQITFETDPADEKFRVGDYWVFAARAVGSSSVEELVKAPPRGIHHHYCRLAVLKADEQGDLTPHDCRQLFPPVTELTSFFYVGGDGQEAMPSTPLLPQLLRVGVVNGAKQVENARVRFQAQDGGRVAASPSKIEESETSNTFEPETGPDGVYSCAWKLKPDGDSSQQLEATLLDAAGNPTSHPPIRFTANLSIASQVAYNPGNCDALGETITNVQAAIDELCQIKERGGCCCVTVGQGAQFSHLNDAIEKLIHNEQREICICLLPGDHDVKPLKIGVQKGQTHLKIEGCARSRIILENPWLFEGLASLALQNVEIVASGFENEVGFIRINQCDEVLINSCHFMGGGSVGGALLAIQGADRICLENSLVEASLKARLKPLGEIFKDTGIDKLFEIASRIDFRRTVNKEAESVLNGLKPKQRSELAKRIQNLVAKSGKKLSDAEEVSYTEFADAIANKPDSSKFIDALIKIRAAGAKQSFVTAIVIADAKADTMITNNEINGAVSLYGVNRGMGLTEGTSKELAQKIKDGGFKFSDFGKTLQMRNNILFRLVVAKETIEQINKVAANKTMNLTGVYRASFFTDNSIESQANQFFSRHLSLTSNTFTEVKGGYAGAAIADSAIFIGNQAANISAKLYNVSNNSRNAANLIDITPFDSLNERRK